MGKPCYCDFLICLSFFFLFFNVGIASQIEAYKDQIPAGRYERLLQEEKEILAAADDPAAQAKGYYELGVKAYRYSYQLSADILTLAISLSEKSAQDSLLALSQTYLARPYMNLNKFAESAATLDKAMAYWESTTDSLNLAKTHISYGSLERRRSNFPKGLNHLLTAKDIQHKLMATHEMGDVYNRLTIMYGRVKDYEKAIAAAEEFVAAAEKQEKVSSWCGPILINCYQAYSQLENYEQARITMKKALPFYQHRKNNKTAISIYGNLAALEQITGDLKLAAIYADSSLQAARSLGAAPKIAGALLSKHSILIESNKLSQAIPLITEAKKIIAPLRDNYLSMHLYQQLARQMEIQSKFKKGFYYQKKIDSLRGVIYSENLVEEIAQTENKMIREQSQKEIDLLSEQNRLKTENLVKANRIKYFLIGLLVLLLISLILIWSLFNLRSRKNKVLREKNKTITKALEENKFLLKEVHHRVKNNLQVVSSLLSLQVKYVNDEAAIQAIKTSKARVQAISLLHQNLYINEELGTVKIRDYFAMLCENLLNTYSLGNKEINISMEIDDLEMEVEQVIPLGLICNELISNALKHAFVDQEKGAINIRVERKSEQLLLEVSDDGKGVPFDELTAKGTSLGIKIIKSFSRKLNAKVEIEKIGGSTFRLMVPWKNKLGA